MIFGAQYDRMPNPRPCDWESDLSKMNDLGLSLARTWLYWRIVNPKEGFWDFSYYDQLFEIASHKNVRIQIQLFIEAPPYYLEKAHPDWLYRNAAGQQEKLVARSAQQIGGYPGFDYSHPKARAAADEYIQKVVERYRDHPSFWGYDIWNEIWMSKWLDSCWCKDLRTVFLQMKYSTIDNLNKAYLTQYGSFEEVVSQDLTHSNKILSEIYLYTMDEIEFHEYMAAELCSWRAETVRKYDPNHPITAHHMNDPLQFDGWALSKSLDGWGVSRHLGTLRDYLIPMYGAMTTAKEKPWWLAENGSGSVWDSHKTPCKTTFFLQTTMVIATMLKAAGIMFWQFRPEIRDAESPNFGLVKLNGQDTKRSKMVFDYIKMYRKNQSLFENTIPISENVGLVFSPVANRMNQVIESGLIREFAGWHTALCQNGCFPVIFRDTDIINSIPDCLKLLILPMEIIEMPGFKDTLLSWIEKGGILVASGRTFIYDSKMYAQREYPGKNLFGVNEDGSEPYDGKIIYFGAIAGQTFLNSGGYKINCELFNAQPIGAVDKYPVAALNNIGKGKAIWFGCMPGVDHNYSQVDGLYTVVASLLAEAGIKPEFRATGGILVNLVKGRDCHLLFTLNLTDRSVETWIQLPEMNVVEVYDLINDLYEYKGNTVTCFPIHLEAEQSKILVLKC